jgi:hypothetical protein
VWGPRELVRVARNRRGQVRSLRIRVGKLEAEVQELRRLNRRTAEIADVVQEVLVPAANRDDERVRRLLDDYRDAL